MSSINKRQRNNFLTLEKKLEILKRHENGESVTSLAKVFNVSPSTISKCKGRKLKIEKFALDHITSDSGLKKRKTTRKPQDSKLDQAVYLWFNERRSNGEPISGPLLCEKALDLNNKFGGSPDFKASSGWLKNFKSRHGIRQIGSQRESLSVDSSTADTFEEIFLDILKNEGYSLDDVYNANETGLNWKTLPRKSLASWQQTSTSGFKVSKERITIMVAANATGSHSLPLLMIGKFAKPQCFKDVSRLPLVYKAQRSAWMSMEIFLDWYVNDFIPEVKKFRERKNKTGKVLLLLDNAPSHPVVDILNVVDENFKVMYLPPNVAPLIQPMDQGIIGKLKVLYKKLLLRRLLLLDDEESVLAFLKNLNLKHCCDMITDVWMTVSQDNLQKAWHKLLKRHEKIEEIDVINSEELDAVVDLIQAIPGLSDCDKHEAMQWLKDDTDPVFQCMEDDEILPLMQEDEEEIEDDNDEVQKRSRPSNEEAFTALETVMAWGEQQKISCPIKLLVLKTFGEEIAAKCKQ